MAKRTLNSICLVGGGGHALVVAEAAQLQGQAVIGFFDDRQHGSLMHLASSWLGNIEAATRSHSTVPRILAVGDLDFRESLQDVLTMSGNPIQFGNVVHPRAIVSEDAALGNGLFIAAGAIVNCGATIGIHSIINSRAVIEHDCVIGANVHVGPGAVLGGGVQVGSRTLVGLNATIKPNIVIGRNCVVGAGAVVVQNVDDDQVVMGVPARPIPRTDQERRRSA